MDSWQQKPPFISATSTLSKMTVAAGDHTTSLTKQEAQTGFFLIWFCFLKQSSLPSHTWLSQSSTVVSLCLSLCVSRTHLPLVPGALEALLDQESLCDQVDLEHQESLFHPVNIKRMKFLKYPWTLLLITFLRYSLLLVPFNFYVSVCYCGRYITLAHTDLFLWSRLRAA